MAIYSIDTLIEETRRLAAEFRRTTGTMLPVSGEIARFDACFHLQLTANEDRNASFDAVGTGEREGLKIQIKSRVIGDAVKSGHRIGQLNMESDWDRIVLSLMNNDFEPLEMYELSREKIENMHTHDKQRTKRGVISVAKFKAVGDLVWQREQKTKTVAKAEKTADND